MRAAMCSGVLQSMFMANTVSWLPFSAQPTIQPSDGLPCSAPSSPLLARMVAPQTVEEIDLLDRVDAEVAGEPELVDAASDIAVAVLKKVNVLLHALRPDA